MTTAIDIKLKIEKLLEEEGYKIVADGRSGRWGVVNINRRPDELFILKEIKRFDKQIKDNEIVIL